MRRLLLRTLVVLTAIGLVQLVPVPMAWGAPQTRIAVVGDARGGRPSPFPASHFGIRWTGDEEAVVHVRSRNAEGWTPWRQVGVDHDMTEGAGGVVYSSLVTTERAERVETRVVAGDVHDLKVTAFDTRYGPRRLVRAGRSGEGAKASMSDTRVAQPGVVSRAQWGADESLRKGEPSFAPLSRLVVHHTDTLNGDPDPAATVRAIYAYHTQSRGWNDIGYNFLVDEQGRIYEGRYSRAYASGQVPTGEDANGRGVIGAHSEGANTGSVGVALLGNFTSRTPTGAALESLRSMLAWKADRHDINVTGSSSFTRADGTTVALPNLSGHRDVKSTACPGQPFYDMLPTLRQQVATRVAEAHGTTKGYWTALSDGRVFPFGEARSFGSMEGHRLNAGIIGMAATTTAGGYWLLGGDGGIFSFGDARFHGSTGSIRLNKPIVGMAATPSGNGYWLVASDGGIFAFGDAGFFGSTGSIRLNKPVVGMAPTRSGQGYWLVASDGGIFAFGDARFHGSTGSIRLNSPVVSMAAAPDGGGYWLIARDGGVFAFNVPYHGSIPGLGIANYSGASVMRGTATGRGYYVLGLDGGVVTFGDAKFHGARNAAPATARDMALLDSLPTP